MPEKYHGWTLTHEPPKKGEDHYTVRAESGKPGDVALISSAEVDDTMGAETLLHRLKLDIALLEFNRNTGEEQRAWGKRLAQASRDEKEHRIERRLKAASAANAETDEAIVHRLTGAKMSFKGSK